MLLKWSCVALEGYTTFFNPPVFKTATENKLIKPCKILKCEYLGQDTPLEVFKIILETEKTLF